MSIPDEAVEAACTVYAKETGYYVEFHRGLSSESATKMRAGMRAALSAALPLLPREGVVEVMELEWTHVPRGKYVGLAYRADSVFGEYIAQKGRAYFDHKLIDADGPTLADGKAAAQADYERRIRSALRSGGDNG